MTDQWLRHTGPPGIAGTRFCRYSVGRCRAGRTGSPRCLRPAHSDPRHMQRTRSGQWRCLGSRAHKANTVRGGWDVSQVGTQLNVTDRAPQVLSKTALIATQMVAKLSLPQVAPDLPGSGRKGILGRSIGLGCCKNEPAKMPSEIVQTKWCVPESTRQAHMTLAQSTL